MSGCRSRWILAQPHNFHGDWSWNNFWGWSGGAKVLCILHHRGVQLILGVVGWCEGAVYLTSLGRQLILAYSWARPAILVVGKDRGGMFLFLLFLHFHSCSSFFPVPLFHLLYSLFSPTLSSISFGGGRVGEGAVYLTSLGRPTDIGLQLGKACYPCSG